MSPSMAIGGSSGLAMRSSIYMKKVWRRAEFSGASCVHDATQINPLARRLLEENILLAAQVVPGRAVVVVVAAAAAAAESCLLLLAMW